MSESVASALGFMDNDSMQQTRVFIWMVDKFFDYLNVKGPKVALLKRKDSIAPYKSPNDERFKVGVPGLINSNAYTTMIIHVCIAVAG